MRRETIFERLPRSIFVWTSLFFLFAIYGLFVAPLVALLGALGFDPDRRLSALLAQAGFTGFLVWSTPVGLARIRGDVPDDGPFIIVSNHESGLDSALVLAVAPRPTRLVSKGANWRIPMVGLAIWSSGAIFLREEKALGATEAVPMLGEAERSLAHGVSVAFFVEGSRSRGRGVRRFRRGAFELAAATRTPILPMVIVGSGEFMPPGVTPLAPYRVTLEVLAPRRVEGDVDAFRRALRDEVAARHAAILAEPFHASTRAERTSVPTSEPFVESRERSFTAAS